MEQTNKAGGPAAPKDAVEKRPGFYIIKDAEIEATARENGTFTQELYMDGRIEGNARYVGGINSEEVLSLLKTAEGIRKLVHSVGVRVTAAKETGPITFVYMNYGRTDRYGGGTRIRKACPTDGSELLLVLEEQDWREDDEQLGMFAFEFEAAGRMAEVSIVLYVNDGFTVPPMEEDDEVDADSFAYHAMTANSLVQTGNTKRLLAAVQKAKRGEEVTLAYIGGSITQGAGAKPIHTECYAHQAYQRFCKRYALANGTPVRFTKAGIGGTPSELGMVRFDREVLRDGTSQPDVIVIEFAVNDEGDETKGICYESLVRKALALPWKPAVVLLFSVFINDWNLQERLAPIGKHYDLPMVSVRDAVTPQFGLRKEEGRVLSKRQFFYDTYHPTNLGHQIMADCLDHLFVAAEAAGEAKADIPAVEATAPLLGAAWQQVRLLDRKDGYAGAEIVPGSFTKTDSSLQLVERDDEPHLTAEFPYNWSNRGIGAEESFRMTIQARSLVLVYKDSGDLTCGKAEVFVDGAYCLTADPHLNNWTHCNPVILYTDRPGMHTVEIRMATGDEEKYFTILGFGYVE